MSLLSDFGTGSSSGRAARTSMPLFDALLIGICAALVLFGLLMVYSASIALADGPRYANYGQYYFVLRHALFIVIGVVAALIALTIPMRVGAFAVPLFLFCLLLLVIVLIPGVGRSERGSPMVALGDREFPAFRTHEGRRAAIRSGLHRA